MLAQHGDIETNPGPITSEKQVSICHINANSLLANNNSRLELIEAYLINVLQFDIICISETKLDNSIPSSEVAIDGYTIYRLDRSRRGGGVAIYVTNNLISSRYTTITQKSYG